MSVTLKTLSVLLCYPDSELYHALPEIGQALQADDTLPSEHKMAVQQLMTDFQATDLIKLQENYVLLFDRGRQLSLHIFEHIHGESRDRGQAMVDLMTMYQNNGFEMNAHELPDYLPLFLEYLAQRPHDEAKELLSHIVSILHSLAQRLEAKQSPYFVIFDALSGLIGQQRADSRQVPKSDVETDETILNMDEIWEEETVRFMANSNSCAEQTAEQPLKFTPPKQANAH